MVEPKAWNWRQVNDAVWQEPAGEFYSVAWRWCQCGFKNILDLGCGKGRHAVFMARLGFKVNALDLSPEGVDMLKEEVQNNGLDIECTVGDMHKLPYSSNEFDAVLAYNVIYHTDGAGLKQALGQIRRVLKPGGEAFITFNSKKNPSFSALQHDLLDANTLIKKGGYEDGIPHYYVDEGELRVFLADFEIIRLAHIEAKGEKACCHYFVLVKR